MDDAQVKTGEDELTKSSEKEDLKSDEQAKSCGNDNGPSEDNVTKSDEEKSAGQVESKKSFKSVLPAKMTKITSEGASVWDQSTKSRQESLKTKTSHKSSSDSRQSSDSKKHKTFKSSGAIYRSYKMNSSMSPVKENKGRKGSDFNRAPKLTPVNGFISNLGTYDCCAFIIHCKAHDRILCRIENDVIWMPFTSMLPNLGWEDNALLGFLMIISGSDAEKYNLYKEDAIHDYFQCMHVLRLQLPQTLKFVTRLTYYFSLKKDAQNFKCCQSGINLSWHSIEGIRKQPIPNLWGPELVKYANLDLDETRISEYSLEEAFLYVPRDPPRNMEEDMLKTIRITEKDVERLYEDFLDHCFPSFYLTYYSFNYYMRKRGFEQNDERLRKFFRAFNYTKKSYLSFHEFLLGLACMEPTIQHGKFRVKFIFRFFSSDSVHLRTEDLKTLLSELPSNEKNQVHRLRVALSLFKGKDVDIDENTMVTEREFVSAIGNHKFRGTSVLCRYQRGIFQNISRAMVDKGLRKTKTVLSNVPIKRRYQGICKTCRERRYQLANHSVSFDSTGQLKSKRLNLKQPSEESVRSTHVNQYSIEIVFNRNSAANIIISLVREFSNAKGTVRKPNGLLQNRKDDLWKLLLSIYNEMDVLLKQEQKCQKLYSPCYVMGDIHGNLEDLFSLEKAFWKQIPCVGANYLFLGDYVDRGQWGFECALYIFAFKILCPTKVTMLRGNHEVRLLQSHYTYKRECVVKYGEMMGLKVWELTNRIFDKLPVCATIDDVIFCAHGGLPKTTQDIEQIARIKLELKDPEKESPPCWEMLWSDPCHMQQFQEIADLLNLDPKKLNGFVKNTKRGTAFLFNEFGCNNFLRKNGLSHVIRAHEVPPLGYTFHFGNKCATIFSCSHYCGNDNDCACILVDNQKLRVIHLDTVNNASATD